MWREDDDDCLVDWIPSDGNMSSANGTVLPHIRPLTSWRAVPHLFFILIEPKTWWIKDLCLQLAPCCTAGKQSSLCPPPRTFNMEHQHHPCGELSHLSQSLNLVLTLGVLPLIPGDTIVSCFSLASSVVSSNSLRCSEHLLASLDTRMHCTFFSPTPGPRSWLTTMHLFWNSFLNCSFSSSQEQNSKFLSMPRKFFSCWPREAVGGLNEDILDSCFEKGCILESV